MRIREAVPADEAALKAFCCTGAIDGWERDLERAVHDALRWRASGRLRRVTLLLDDEEQLLAVACYQPFYDVTPQYGWIIEVIAVQLAHQDAGIGTFFTNQILYSLIEEAPGGLCGWFVHEANVRSLSIADNVNARDEQVTEPPANHIAKVVRLPTSKPGFSS